MTVLELGTLDAMEDVGKHRHVILRTVSLTINLRHKTNTHKALIRCRAVIG